MRSSEWAAAPVILALVVAMGGCEDDDGGGGAPPSAELSDIAVSAGTLSPVFSPDSTFYTVHGILPPTVTVTPFASDPAATITVNGAAVASGSASGSIPLDPGVNIIGVVVTASDGVTQELYTIAVTRAEADADLMDLAISAVTFSPAFSRDGTFYTVGPALLPSSVTVTPTASDSGASIEVNGTAVASGTPSLPIGLGLGMNTITILVTATDGVTQKGYTVVVFKPGEEAYLKASNTDASDYFGEAIAIDGDTVVVGAPGEDSNEIGTAGSGADNSALEGGAAYVFVRSGGAWQQEAYLKASNTEADDRFGQAVAIDGDTVVVGAYCEDSSETGVNGCGHADNSASMSGAAYVFVRTGGVWAQQAYLKASNTDAADNFGDAVAVDGDTVVVGAYGEASSATGTTGYEADNSASYSGAAYVFTRAGGVWSQEAYLKASNTDVWDKFGYAVAVDSDTVVVGAYYEASNETGTAGTGANNNAPESGAAYVFVRSGGVWTQEDYLKASNTDAGDGFGCAVAVDGDTVVVGANQEDSNETGTTGTGADNSAPNSGAVYVFR